MSILEIKKERLKELLIILIPSLITASCIILGLSNLHNNKNLLYLAVIIAILVIICIILYIIGRKKKPWWKNWTPDYLK